jgi:cell division protease FtsH
MNPAPPGSAPLHYATPPQYTMPPRSSRFGRGLLGWCLFIGLTVMLVVLVRNKSQPRSTEIALSDFHELLRAGKVEYVTIEADELRGKLLQQQLVPGSGAQTVLYFRVSLPENMSGDWKFNEWMLANANGARVSAEHGGSLMANIVVPLIPWLLIFGFIWFFVLRQLRTQAGRTQQPMPVYVVNPGFPGAAPPHAPRPPDAPPPPRQPLPGA